MGNETKRSIDDWIMHWSTGDRSALVFKVNGKVYLSGELEPKKGNYDLNYDPISGQYSYKRIGD